MDTLPNLFDLLTWAEPREVNTKRGQMILKKAPIEDAFWPLWDRFHVQYKMMGFSVSKDLRTQKPVLCHWSPVDSDELDRRDDNIVASRAVRSEFNAPCPEGLAYLPFQVAGIEWCMSKDAAYVADSMGLGKTIQAIGAANCIADLKRMLVVTKASLKLNWKRELEKWLVHRLPVGIAEGQKWPKTPVVVINYDVLAKHYNRLRESEWDLVVLDESHSIKNPAAKRTLQILGYTPSKKRQEQGEKVIDRLPGRKRIALSGTPIENNIADLWCVLNYLDPVKWPSYFGFVTYWAGMVRVPGRGFVPSKPPKTAELQKVLRSTLMIRRLKEDVLKELPPITRMIHELDPDGLEQFVSAEQKFYASKEQELLNGQIAVELARCEPDKDRFREAVKSLGGAAFAFDELAKLRAQTAYAMVPKVLPVILDDIEEAGKAIVFGHHRAVLHALQDGLKGSVMVNGETPGPERQAAVDRFQNDPSCRWFIGSTIACGEGITLTAARLVYFVEEDWNPAKISQAESRPHRIGQTGNVLVKHFIVPGTINARMINVCIQKQELAEKTLDIDPDTAAEPLFVPYHPVGTRKELLSEAMLITESERRSIHEAIKSARFEDAGEIDFKLIRSLSEMETITQGQAALGRKLLLRYPEYLTPEVATGIGAKAPVPRT